MRVIKITHESARQRPLDAAKRFVLMACDCLDIPVTHYPQCTVCGRGFIAPETEYIVDIACDNDEIHAYFRWPSLPLFTVLEVIFFKP